MVPLLVIEITVPIVIQINKYRPKLFKIDFKIKLNGNTVDLISILPAAL